MWEGLPLKNPMACSVFHVFRGDHIIGARIARNVANMQKIGWIGMGVVPYVALTSP